MGWSLVIAAIAWTIRAFISRVDVTTFFWGLIQGTWRVYIFQEIPAHWYCCLDPSCCTVHNSVALRGAAASFNPCREVLVLLCTICHEVDIICESQAADWSAIDGDWRVVVGLLKNSPRWLFWSTALVASSYKTLMILISGSSMLQSLMTFHKPSCHTRSKASLKSMML